MHLIVHSFAWDSTLINYRSTCTRGLSQNACYE